MTGDNLKWSIEYYEANTDSCNTILENDGNFEKIPLIKDSNIHQFKDGDLVRYIGMVQEILNPEYYLQASTTYKGGRYRDFIMNENLEQFMLDDKNLGERGVYFLIPIPYASHWVTDCLRKPNETEGRASPMQETRKRPAPDNDEESDINTTNSHKHLKNESGSIQNGEKSESVADAMDMYYPLHKRTELPCILKFSNHDQQEILMNERIEVVGFLSLDPGYEWDEENGSIEGRGFNPPSSLLPRLHGIACRKLKHSNPLLNFRFNSSEIIATAEKVRSDLHLVLSQILNDDPFMADYMICYLLSRVFTRAWSGPVGHFTFNICKIKQGSYPQRLYKLIDGLVTNSHYLPLSLNTLNETYFNPEKNYERDRLFSGRLQFCDGTYLILDETVMEEGQLNCMGTANVSALGKLIANQVVEYNFQYYSLSYDADIPVLIVSDGPPPLKSKISLDMNPFPDEETIRESFDSAEAFLQGKVVEDIRKYLTCMRMQEFEISEELAARASEDFVKIRRIDTRFSAQDFDILLTLARLMALSYGRTSLTLDDWLRAVEMEKERKLRQKPQQ